MPTTKSSLRLAKYVVKRSNFPLNATVFSDNDDAAKWRELRHGLVFENEPAFVNGIYGNWINPVGYPENRFFIPDDFFTRDFFAPTTQPIKFHESADIRH